MRTLNILPNCITFYTNRVSDIPSSILEDNITLSIKRNADFDIFLSDTSLSICNNAEDYRLECSAAEVHIEDRGSIKFIHTVSETGTVEDVQPFPEKITQLLDAFSENASAIYSGLIAYSDSLYQDLEE